MRIEIHQSTVAPMIDWLKQAVSGHRDEAALRALFAHPDYLVEFARYGSNLPVCGINEEEAVDFFLHFDEKEFDNLRLATKKESFCRFVQSLDAPDQKLQSLFTLTDEDITLVQTLLENALPGSLLDKLERIKILLTVSIGNSMGWPHEGYIHFDVAGMDAFEDKESFLHVLAHEIHHLLFPMLLGDQQTSRQWFFANFAFEGLAVHFCNNASAVGKPARYPGKTFCMQEEDMAFYRSQHRELVQKLFADARRANDMTRQQVDELISEYEQFSFPDLRTGEMHPIKQYPTYYLGCWLWGLVELRFGKEKLFEVLRSRDGMADLLPMLNLCGADCASCPSMGKDCPGCACTCADPFGKGCVHAECCLSSDSFRQTVLDRVNAADIPDLPPVTELIPLRGCYVNLAYPMEDGTARTLLDPDRIYLGTQLPKPGTDRFFGIIADRDFVLVAEYGATGAEPKLLANLTL